MEIFDLLGEDIITEHQNDKIKQLRSEKQQIKNELYKQKVVQKKKDKKKKIKQQKYEMIQTLETQEQKNQFVHSFKGIRNQKKENGIKSLQSPFKIIIDCGFEDNMSDKEQRSLARQLSELYTENRRMDVPLKLYVTNIYPILHKYLEQYNYKQWQLLSDERLFTDIEEFQQANIVYLSPDGEEELQEIKEDEVYVIGGLVDRVILKNATLNRSRQLGVRCAKLPIGQLIKKNYKKCLNVSTAALMISGWLKYKDWSKAFDSIVPQKFKEQDEEPQLQ
ncbi:unnamed protein product [Paramecium pentaurelia]|uniref:tRNA (guanine(9)-N(1))-methyltransferase n=1 Tax=Paramecium pentaurelia TaxID=43138 RepID=A0A8S1VF67_9CILI|nr:unnamed protein product [Paramecium pentaurelia]